MNIFRFIHSKQNYSTQVYNVENVFIFEKQTRTDNPNYDVDEFYTEIQRTDERFRQFTEGLDVHMNITDSTRVFIIDLGVHMDDNIDIIKKKLVLCCNSINKDILYENIYLYNVHNQKINAPVVFEQLSELEKYNDEDEDEKQGDDYSLSKQSLMPILSNIHIDESVDLSEITNYDKFLQFFSENVLISQPICLYFNVKQEFESNKFATIPVDPFSIDSFNKKYQY